jgi:FtsH-binding integral membrane protein
MRNKGSEFTQITRKKMWFYTVLDWVLLFAPVFIYVVMALFDGGVTKVGKVSIVGTVMIAAILTVFNVFRQKKLRSPIWIILIGLYVAFREWLLPLIIILAITTTIDDLFLGPIVKYYRAKLVASKTIDEREESKIVETKPE